MPKKPELKTPEGGWQDVEMRIIDLPIPASHMRLMRYVFMAGASFMLQQTEILGQPETTDEEALAYYDLCREELADTVADGLLEIAGALAAGKNTQRH